MSVGKVDVQRDYKPCAYEAAIDPCPICAHAAALFEYTAGPDDDGREFVVSCDSPSPEGLGDFECPWNPPPWSFHRARKVEAVEAWNDFARLLLAAREKNALARIGGAQ